MIPQVFNRIQQAHAAGGPEAAFDELINTLRAEKNYDALFDALLLRQRHALGLSLLSSPRISTLDPAMRKRYEEAYVASCREVGHLFLESDDVPNAWRYFRTIGEPEKVREALARIDEGDNMEELINIAFDQGVDPRRGFEWIVKHFGVCRAITCYEQFPPGAEGRLDCVAMLVRDLYRELLDNVRFQIEQREGTAPASARLADLLRGRDWLYEDSYLIDVSHLAAVARFSIEHEDPEILRMAFELADYGHRLPDAGFYSAGVSVQEHLADCSVYLRALRGEAVETAIAHFRRKTEANATDVGGSGAAPLLVYLLVRTGHVGEALEVSRQYLANAPAEDLRLCPSFVQLCQMSGNLDRLLDYARERHDVLTFISGIVSTKVEQPERKG